MEQTQSDNSTSSVLTPIDNNIIRTHAIRKIKRNKRNRRALFHRRKYDINKRRSQHAVNTPTSMSYPPNQCQKTVASSTPECPNAITCTSTSPLNQQQQTIIPKSSNQPVIASSVSEPNSPNAIITPTSTPFTSQQEQIILSELSNRPITEGLTSSVSEPDSSSTYRYHPNIDFFQLQESLSDIDLGTDWKVVHNDKGIHLYKIKMGQISQPVIERSVSINVSMSWHAHAMGKLLTHATCQLLRMFPQRISSIAIVKEIADAIDRAHICPGNPDPEMVELFERRGHSITTADNHNMQAAYIDVVDVTNSNGALFARTVRHNECDILCQQKERYPHMCSACQLYRSNLRVMRWRSQQCDSLAASRTAHNSHTNIRFLNVKEMEERLRNVQQKKKIVTAKVQKLEEKMKKDIDENGVMLSEPEVEVVRDLIEDASDTVYRFPKDSVQYILWEEQKKCNALKDKRQMRWHPLVIRFALSLKYASTAAFQQVTKLGFLALPSERTLRDYTHWCSIKTGMQAPFINQLKHAIKEEKITEDKKQFCLLMDEMKIKSGLVFSKSSGKLIGFCDLSNVNTEIDDLSYCLSGECTNQPAKLASHMLVFMVRPVCKPSLCFTIAMYPSSNITGNKLYPIVWEVIESLEMNLLPVISVTSDGASSNRRFYKLCKDGGANHKTRNPFDPNRHIFFFCDAPHLLKTARNCFSNSHCHLKTRKLEVSVSQLS